MIKDALGNELEKDNLVYYRGQLPCIGKIVEIHEPAISLALGHQKGPVPVRVRVVFDAMLSLTPGASYCHDLFRVVNPQSEEIIKRILDEAQPTQ